jgi:hypothetical protein
MNALEKKHALLDSVEEMLSPESLSQLLKRPVNQIDCFPFESSNGFSGNEMFHVTVDGQPLVMKRMLPGKDWNAISSNDYRCRAVRVWQFGLLDQIQTHICHGTIAACMDGDDYAILMHDVSSGLGPDMTPPVVQSMLDGLAAMHARFWEDERLTAHELSLCDVRARLAIFGTENLHLYTHTPQIAEMIAQGFEFLLEMVEPDVRDVLQNLLQNPHLLSDALSNYPATLIHGDYRHDNLAVMPESNELFAFDWQIVAYAPATIDLFWFIYTSPGIFHKREATIDYYQQRLFNLLGARFDQALWPAMVDLGGLVTVLTAGSWNALAAATRDNPDYRRRVALYNDLIRRGLQWL